MKRLLAVLLCLLLLAGLLPAQNARAVSSGPNDYVLPVFETSDLHGYLVNTAYENEASYQYRLAYIADKVDDARGGDARRTVLLDGGDVYQGNVVSNLQNGAPMVAAFDAMEYDAVGLGNHEFDWGIEKTTDPDGTMPHYTLGGQTRDSTIPILCCNIYEAGTYNRVGFTKDYVILDKLAAASDGSTLPVRVAVVGYVNDYSSSIMGPRIAPYTIRSGVSRAETIARSLKSQGLADAAILLTHADAESVAGSLSSGTPFDLVCGGHTHQQEAGFKNGVAYMEPASQATHYARAELHFDASGKPSAGTPALISVTGQSGKLTDSPANASELAADVLAVSHSAIEGVQEALQTKLGYITTSVTASAIGDNPMSTTGGNWMTDLANRATGSKVSFTNSGGIRTSFYVNSVRRYITKGDLYTIAPFNNRLYVYEITYAELLQLMEYAVGRGSGLGLRMSGIDCYYSGSKVTALVEDGVCIYKDGSWADGVRDRTIRVSANEFIATSSGTPFAQWNGSSRFDNCDLVDNESFIAVLEQEGLAHGGLLYVDPQPHLIRGEYAGGISRFYRITTSCGEGGTVTPGRNVPAGGSYTVDITPDPGWRIAGVKIDGSSREIRTQYVFRSVSADHELRAEFERTDPCEAFTDVDRSAWYHEAVDYAVSHGLFNGTSETAFSPDQTMSRAMLVTVLYRMAGKPPVSAQSAFTDVRPGQYYADAVAWASAQSIVKGYPDGRFRPDDPVTREQLTTFLQRYARWDGLEPEEQAELSGFPDAQAISAYAVDAIRWAVAVGLIAGTTVGGVVCLAPGAYTTRAQVATVLMRYLEDLPRNN